MRADNGPSGPGQPSVGTAIQVLRDYFGTGTIAAVAVLAAMEGEKGRAPDSDPEAALKPGTLLRPVSRLETKQAETAANDQTFHGVATVGRDKALPASEGPAVVEPQPTRDPTRLLTIDEAAEYLRLTAATLRAWRTRRPGFGPSAVLMGGRVVYRIVDLDNWVESRVERFDAEGASLVDSPSRRGKSVSTAPIHPRRSAPRAQASTNSTPIG